MKINKRDVDGKWYKFEGKVEFKIRPFKLTAMPDIDGVMNSAVFRFDYILTDWKGFENESGGEFKCNEENKLFFLDYYSDVADFVIKKSEEQSKHIKEEIKN